MEIQMLRGLAPKSVPSLLMRLFIFRLKTNLCLPVSCHFTIRRTSTQTVHLSEAYRCEIIIDDLAGEVFPSYFVLSCGWLKKPCT